MRETADLKTDLNDADGNPLPDSDRMRRAIAQDLPGGVYAVQAVLAGELRRAESAAWKDARHSDIRDEDVWFKQGVVVGLRIALSIRTEAAKP